MKIGRRHSLLGFAKHVLIAGVMAVVALPALSDEYASIAASADGSWGWARKETQQRADKAALEGCKKVAPNGNCKVAVVKALVRAEGANRMGYGSGSTLKDARAFAIESCGDADCKSIREITQPGFFAIARAKDETSASIHLVYGASNSDDVKKEAIEICEQKFKEKCHLAQIGAIAGKIAEASPRPVLRPAPAASANPQSCRPNAASIRCTSQCTNGNCVVSYENGCKVRVQVSPRYDPFTNQWVYPSPSC